MAIYEYPGFIEPELCDAIINRVENELTVCGILGKQTDNYRVAEGTWLEAHDVLVKRITEKTAALTGYPLENQEKPHIVRYIMGGEYKAHHDFFHSNQNYTDLALKRGGQRVKSFLIYLNDTYQGGETEFPTLGVTIKPERGKAVLWNNLTKEGKPDHNSLHAGLPVTGGTKIHPDHLDPGIKVLLGPAQVTLIDILF